MRRALFVAGDRALTRMHAEALLARDLEAHPAPGEAWAAARAHSGLEAKVLIEHGRRPFDAIVVAPRLPDIEGLELIRELRALDATRQVPLFLFTERGRDTHSRRIAAARYRVAGFIELPAPPGNIRAALEQVRRRRRVLIVDARSEPAERYRIAFERGGFVPEVCPAPRDARPAAKRFQPDLAAVALVEGDASPDGLAVCAELRRLDPPPRVLLYGPLSALASRSIGENAHRADDFVKAPFDDELLVARAAALVGLGAPEADGDPPPGADPTPVLPATRLSEIDGQLLHRRASDRRRVPRRASSLPRAGARRGHRRVPCDITLEVESDGRVFHAQTLDISHGGLFFALDPPFDKGTRLRMRFELPNEQEISGSATDGGEDHTPPPIQAEGQVAWVGSSPEGTAGMGVRFSRIDPGDLERIVDYVNRLAGVLYAP